MGQRSRRRLTPEERHAVWARWRRGQTFGEIERALGLERRIMGGVVAATGGYPPPARRRSIRVLSLIEREEISRGVAAGLSLPAIARATGRAVSTLSREIGR
jgi:hypothetical protein